MEPYFEAGSVNDFGFVSDFDSGTGSDSTIEEYSQPSILRLAVGSSQQYDRL